MRPSQAMKDEGLCLASQASPNNSQRPQCPMEPETIITTCVTGENLYIKPQTETVWQEGSTPGFSPLGIHRDFWVLGWEENEGEESLLEWVVIEPSLVICCGPEAYGQGVPLGKGEGLSNGVFSLSHLFFQLSQPSG